MPPYLKASPAVNVFLIRADNEITYHSQQIEIDFLRC